MDRAQPITLAPSTDPCYVKRTTGLKPTLYYNPDRMVHLFTRFAMPNGYMAKDGCVPKDEGVPKAEGKAEGKDGCVPKEGCVPKDGDVPKAEGVD
jgi:hypothetical protein